MSANRSVTGISAPVTPIFRYWLMQFWQMAGLPGNRPKPKCFMTAPPGPPNGALHSLQRGDDGMRFRLLRKVANPGCSPVRICRKSSLVQLSGMARLYAPSRGRGCRRDLATT